jgi:hypothetical protein
MDISFVHNNFKDPLNLYLQSMFQLLLKGFVLHFQSICFFLWNNNKVFISVLLKFILFFWGGDNGVWTQDYALARQVFHYLTQKVSRFSSRWTIVWKTHLKSAVMLLVYQRKVLVDYVTYNNHKFWTRSMSTLLGNQE